MPTTETIKEDLASTAVNLSEKLEPLMFYPFEFLVDAEIKVAGIANDIFAKAITTIESGKKILATAKEIGGELEAELEQEIPALAKAKELATELKQEIPGIVEAIPGTTARLARTIKEEIARKISNIPNNIGVIPQETKPNIHEHRTIA